MLCVELLDENLPASFREFPNTRCIINYSEIYVEKPFRPKAQRTTWSNYKADISGSRMTYREIEEIQESGEEEPLESCTGFHKST
jgi:hypothetical protein